jgi:hypothetical protein
MNDTRVAIDINDLSSEAILNALLENKGEVFRTARGRTAILIGRAAFLKLQQQLGLYVEDGHDGSQVLRG